MRMRVTSPVWRRPLFPVLVFISLLVCGAALSAVDLDKMQSLALSRYGPNTETTVQEWRQLIVTIAPLAEDKKLEAVNDFFNARIRWVEDIDNWGENDYWATPLETMARRKGDCEDFSVAKFVTLLLGGVAMNKLRITYVRAQSGGPSSANYIAHMVLAYYPTPSADPLILDNMVELIRPGSQRADLKPVFGFNTNGLWVGGSAAPTTKDPAAKLSRWRDLLQRMSADGLG
jgi:predicted transglutaminase-like cysteine proteinase